MKKLLLISLIAILLLIVACSKTEVVEPKKAEKAPAAKAEVVDCGKDINCFVSNAVKGEKATVEIMQKDLTSGKDAGTALFESRGKTGSDIVVYEIVNSINTDLLFAEQESNVKESERPCFNVVKKEMTSFAKQMEGKEIVCKLSITDLSNVQSEQQLNLLINTAASLSLEQDGQPDPSNPFLIKLKPKEGGVCTGSMLNYIGNSIVDMFRLFEKIAESDECNSLLAKGGKLPGVDLDTATP